MVLGLAKNDWYFFRYIFDRHGCREIVVTLMIFTVRGKFDATAGTGNEGK